MMLKFGKITNEALPDRFYRHAGRCLRLRKLHLLCLYSGP